jgi:hypothetical protein
MRTLAGAFAALALLGMAGCAASQPAPPPTPPATSSQEAATRGLATLRALARQGQFAALGFTSAEEADAATLGAPLHVFMVRLDQLKQYQPGADAASLLTDIGQDFYPVLVGGQTRSSITVSSAEGHFAAVRFGGAALARSLAQRQQEMMSAPVPRKSGPPQNFEVVHVAALNLYFLGFQQRGQFMVIPTADSEQLGLRAGVPQPANAVFARLAGQARTMNPDVPT